MIARQSRGWRLSRHNSSGRDLGGGGWGTLRTGSDSVLSIDMYLGKDQWVGSIQARLGSKVNMFWLFACFGWRSGEEKDATPWACSIRWDLGSDRLDRDRVRSVHWTARKRYDREFKRTTGKGDMQNLHLYAKYRRITACSVMM